MSVNAATKQAVEEYYCSKSPVYWCKCRRSLHGKPYKFWGDHPVEQRLFLEEPLNDTSQRMCGKKARQLGWSENSASFALWFADTHPHTGVIYTLPTNDFVSDFSNTRIQPIIDQSPYLRNITGDLMGNNRRKLENVKLKKINTSYFFLRSMGSERAGMGFPIDLAIWDEVDASDEHNKEVFQAMLDASKYKWERELSTPTIPGRGISRTYQMSDMKKWEVKCEKCGHWQFMKWPDSVVEFHGKYLFICLHCRQMDCLDRAHGRYTRQGPKDAPYSGYHVSQLEAPWFTAEDIHFKYKRSRYPQLFYNLVLGLEYVGDNVLLTEDDLVFCRAPEITREIANDMKSRGKVMHGIDWGDTTWGLTGVPVRYEGREKLLITDIHKWDDPDINMHTRYISMMVRTNNSFLTILDAGYGKAQNLSLMKEYQGRKIWACQYVNTKRGATARVVPVWTENQKRVTVQRDAQIKYYFQNYKDKMIVLPGYLWDDPNWQEFVSQTTSLVISREEKEGEVVESIEKMRADHLSHAGVYLLTAFEKLTTNSVRVGYI